MLARACQALLARTLMFFVDLGSSLAGPSARGWRPVDAALGRGSFRHFVILMPKLGAGADSN